MAKFVFDMPADCPPELRDPLREAWLTGAFDSVPVPTDRQSTARQLTLERTENESSYVCAILPLESGSRVVTSATLRSTPQPYQPLVELARGALNRVRQFVGVLASAGFEFPEEFTAQLRAVTKQFGQLVLGLASSPQAAEVIHHSTVLGDRCAELLTSYRLKTRTSAGPLTTKVGCRLSRALPPAEQLLYTELFNAIRIVPDWSQIEAKESVYQWGQLDALVDWATANKLDISFGPLIDLTDGQFPAWFKGWRGDLPNLAAFASDFVGSVIQRYHDRVRMWHIFAGFNQADTLGLGEDDRLRFAARLLETVQEMDPSSARSFGIAQPWGEYLTNEELTYGPYVFADTLLRVGYQLHGLELELLSGGRGKRSQRPAPPRDALDLVHQMELFDNLGLPLKVVLGYGAEQLAATALAAPSLRGLYWDTWSEADPCSRHPDQALVNVLGDPTQHYHHLMQLRKSWC